MTKQQFDIGFVIDDKNETHVHFSGSTLGGEGRIRNPRTKALPDRLS